MAIIQCPECGHKVSDAAQACPSCAYPIAAPPHSKPTTIQATGKTWKELQLLSGLAFAIGIVWLFISVSIGTVSSTALFLSIIGFTGYLVGRVGAWWHHG